jgi:hypothetical protein
MSEIHTLAGGIETGFEKPFTSLPLLVPRSIGICLVVGIELILNLRKSGTIEPIEDCLKRLLCIDM